MKPIHLLLCVPLVCAVGLGCEGNIDQSRDLNQSSSNPSSQTNQPFQPNTPTSTTGTGSGSGTTTPGGPQVPVELGEVNMKRLTAVQYHLAVRELLGEGLPKPNLEVDTNPYLFYSIGAAQTTLSSYGTELYFDAGLELVNRVFEQGPKRQALLQGCNEQACTEAFITKFGRRALRRPLSSEEVARWTQLARDTGVEGDYESGMFYVVSGFLQHPEFLYRIELGEQDPAHSADLTRRRYTSWEMASRLSFLLWNSIPDETLLDAAQNGELLDDESIVKHTMRMLDDPKASEAVQRFFAQYLDLVKLKSVERDPKYYPNFDPALLGAMETEVKLLVHDLVFRRDEDIRKLFSEPRAFVNSDLATHYKIDAPGATPYTFVPVDLPTESNRAGVLTLGAFLTLTAHSNETSPTLRGKFIRERVYCTVIPSPPDDVDLDLTADSTQPKTLRERLAEHSKGECAACHNIIDPPGLVFENFGSVGEYRTQVEGLAVDSKVNIDGKDFDQATELATFLGQSDVAANCIVEQLYAHAQGRAMTSLSRWERRELKGIKENLAMTGYRFKDLLVLLAINEAFRTVSPQEEVSP